MKKTKPVKAAVRENPESKSREKIKIDTGFAIARESDIFYDLVRRARGGIFIYPFVWIITMWWADMFHRSPDFCTLNSVIFLVLTILRILLDLTRKRIPEKNKNRIILWLEVLILISCLHWGVISAWIIFNADYPELHYMYIVILAAFAAGGTATLSIARKVRVFYPLFMFGPSVLIAIFIGGGENYILALLAVLTTMYLLDSSRVSAEDYFRAKHHQKNAENKSGMLLQEIEEHKRTQKKLEKLITELQFSLNEIKTLRGFLPICSCCKKIRDDQGYWNQIEAYIEKHSSAEFSHGLCPECSDQLYGNTDWYIKMKKKNAK